MFSRWLLILVLILPLTAVFHKSPAFAYADEKGDEVEGEEVNVDDDPADLPDDGSLTGGDADATEEDAPSLRSNPDADTHFLFTKPSGMGLELPAGKDVNFLVGFTNKGQKELTLETMEASFRYAMDFTYHLQNFSAIAYNRVVRPQEEATLAYSFFVSEAYSARPYGFTVNLYYKDAEGNQFVNAVFNETVSIVELDEGLDGETFFLYVLMAAVVVLLVVGAQQYISSKSRKHTTTKKIEMGTASQDDIDYSWIPKETLEKLNKSPNAKMSPRQRRVKRGTGADE